MRKGLTAAEVEKVLREEFPGAEFKVTVTEFQGKDIVGIETDLIEDFTDRELIKLEQFREKKLKTTRTLTSAIEKARTREIVREKVKELLTPMVERETTVFVEALGGTKCSVIVIKIQKGGK